MTVLGWNNSPGIWFGRRVKNNPFYTRRAAGRSSGGILVYPCDFFGRANVTPPAAALFSFLQTRRNSRVYTGWMERLWWFLSRFVVRLQPTCYHTLYMLEDGSPAHCTSPLGQPNPFPTDPASDASLRPNRISASFCPRDDFPPPLEIARSQDVFIYFIFFPPATFPQPSLQYSIYILYSRVTIIFIQRRSCGYYSF